MKLDIDDLVRILSPLVSENAGQLFWPEHEADQFSGQTVLITGAGGSIGSAIAELVSRTISVGTLAVLDHDDTLLDSVLKLCSLNSGGPSVVPILADIREPRRIADVFAELRPTIVVHAAALKHVHLLEIFAEEAVATNVFGTLNVLEAAASSGTRFFLNISTDKAVGSTSVLGQTKLVGERLISWFGSVGSRQMHTTSVRLCNVLGSRGSILAQLAESINSARSVPVTHPAVSRYFLTAQDVLWFISRALFSADNGITMAPKLSRSTKIVDLITEIESALGIKLDIEIIGLRPGEQLSESLWDPEYERVVYEGDRYICVKVPPLDPSTARSMTGQTVRSAASVSAS